MRHFKRLFPFAAILVLAFCTAGLAQKACKRHIETVGKFSICPPKDWKVEQLAGQAFNIFVGPENSNINIQQAKNVRAKLAAFVDGSISYLLVHVKEQGADEITVVSRGQFVSAAGLKGVKVVMDLKVRGAPFVSIQYFFAEGSDQKLTVTGTTDPARRSIDEKLFDASVRSLRIQ